MGLTDERFFDEAVINGWITTDTLLNNAAAFSKREQINMRANLEPFPGFRIDITGDRRYSETISSYLRADLNGNFPDSTRTHALPETSQSQWYHGVPPLKRFPGQVTITQAHSSGSASIPPLSHREGLRSVHALTTVMTPDSTLSPESRSQVRMPAVTDSHRLRCSSRLSLQHTQKRP